MMEHSPWSSVLDRFLALALASHLVGLDDLRSHLKTFRQETGTCMNDYSELTAFCNYLVERGVVTRWQCDKLLNGRFRGFFLGNFKLLEPIGHSGTWGVYAAEDISRECRVTLRVGLRNGQPYCEVDE